MELKIILAQRAPQVVKYCTYKSDVSVDCEALEGPFMWYETRTGLEKSCLTVRMMIYWPFSLLMRGSKY
jgi:hypothetical protein